MRFRQAALKAACFLRQKAQQLDGKPQQGSFLHQNTQAQLSLFVPEKASQHCAGSFWSRVYSLIKSFIFLQILWCITEYSHIKSLYKIPWTSHFSYS